MPKKRSHDKDDENMDDLLKDLLSDEETNSPSIFMIEKLAEDLESTNKQLEELNRAKEQNINITPTHKYHIEHPPVSILYLKNESQLEEYSVTNSVEYIKLNDGILAIIKPPNFQPISRELEQNIVLYIEKLGLTTTAKHILSVLLSITHSLVIKTTYSCIGKLFNTDRKNIHRQLTQAQKFSVIETTSFKNGSMINFYPVANSVKNAIVVHKIGVVVNTTTRVADRTTDKNGENSDDNSVVEKTTHVVDKTTREVNGTTRVGDRTTPINNNVQDDVVDTTTPVVERTTGVVEGTTGVVEKTTDDDSKHESNKNGVVDITTDVVKKTTGVVKKTTHVVEKTTGVVEGTTQPNNINNIINNNRDSSCCSSSKNNLKTTTTTTTSTLSNNVTLLKEGALKKVKLEIDKIDLFAVLLYMHDIDLNRLSEKTVRLLIYVFNSEPAVFVSALEYARSNSKTNIDLFLQKTIEDGYYNSLPIEVIDKEIPKRLENAEKFDKLIKSEDIVIEIANVGKDTAVEVLKGAGMKINDNIPAIDKELIKSITSFCRKAKSKINHVVNTLLDKNMVDVPEFLKWNLYREEKPDSL
jgi:hypothetical protein